MRADPGTGLPDRGDDLPLRATEEPADRPVGAGRRDPPDVRPRPWTRGHARTGRLRGDARQPDGRRRQRAPLPGQQGDPRREDRRPRQRAPHRGDRRPARRVRPRRDADRRRAEARRQPPQGAEQPVQAHPDAARLQPQHARPGRRPAADPAAAERPLAPRRLATRNRAAAHRVRPGQGPRPRPHPGGSQGRPRPSRRGDQDDPRVARRRGGARQPDGALRPFGGAGAGDPRHAPGAPGRARAQEDRGRVSRHDPADRRAGGDPRQPAPDRRDRQGRVARAEDDLRRVATDAHRRRCVARDDRRGPDRRRGRRDHRLRAWLHQAPAAGHLPATASRRQGDHRRTHRRRGCAGTSARGQHARLGALLHQPRARLQLQGPPGARRRPDGQGDPHRQPRGRAGRVGRGGPRDDHHPELREGPLPGDGDAARHHQEDAPGAVRARALLGHPCHHGQRGRRAGIRGGDRRSR